MSCSHEHHDHSHGDGHDHVHDHSDDITPALQHSLYQQINFDEVTTLNETVRDSGRAVVKKTWAERLNEEPELASDADEQLLMHIPFTAQVKLHSLLLRTSDSPSAPRTLHVILNRDDLDFSSAEDAQPTQTFELSRTPQVQEIPVKRALFASTRSLTLFFPDNFASALEGSDGGDDDEEVTRISYVGFKGEWTALGRAPINIVYESAARPNDHVVRGAEAKQMGGGIGGRKEQ